MLLLLGAMSLGASLADATIGDDEAQRLRDAVLLGGSTSSAASGDGSAAAASGESDNDTFRAVAPGDWTIVEPSCGAIIGGAWRRPNQHLYFQLGHACFFLAFLATHGVGGQLWLRSMLCIGCVLLGMWGWLVECSSDAVLWSGIFLAVNAVYLVVLLCRWRPVRFDKEMESVYGALFRPLRVTRLQFRRVLGCMRVVRGLKYQEVYAQEKVTKVDSLSLVLSGKLVVSQNQRALHIVFPHQFLDSPEWFGVSTDDYFQVSIMAMEDSRVLIWHRDKLRLSIMSEPFLETVFDHILGRDVVKKLMQVTQVSETMAASNGFLAGPTMGNNGAAVGVAGFYEDIGGLGGGGLADDKQPMLVMRKNGGTADNGGHGITALINRQLQEEQTPLLDSIVGQTRISMRRTSVENLSVAMDDVDDDYEEEKEDNVEYKAAIDGRRMHYLSAAQQKHQQQQQQQRDMKTSMC